MAHFAELNENNIVIRVLKISDEHEADGENWCNKIFGGRWKQTSYNARIRKNYAGIGHYYDESYDAFIPPKPYSSWILNMNTFLWEAPKIKPNDDNDYYWSEEDVNWIKINRILENYGKNKDYELIRHVVEKYNLKPFKPKQIYKNKNFYISYELVNNCIFIHTIVADWNKTILNLFGDILNNLQKELNTTLYSRSQYANEDNMDEVLKLQKFIEGVPISGEFYEDYFDITNKTYRIFRRKLAE